MTVIAVSDQSFPAAARVTSGRIITDGVRTTTAVIRSLALVYICQNITVTHV